jgi:Kef-type K+ transport system membrane component KefB
MLLSSILAVFLYERFGTTTASFGTFALFMGCAMSVTAFPVLARILQERNLVATPFGQTAVACAALADVTTWVLLAGVVAVSRNSGDSRAALMITIAGSIVYIATMFGAVRPIISWLWRRHGRAAADLLDDRKDIFAGIIIAVLLSALTAELLGIHALFGAFLAGTIMPADSALRRAVRARFEDVLSVALLPLFFAYAGIRADLSALDATAWAFLGVIVLVAVVGKVGGTTLAARLTGATWREGAALGSLMNARGLIELVLLTVGLQAGLITPQLFTMMFVMAVVTTIMTVPLLSRLGTAAR